MWIVLSVIAFSLALIFHLAGGNVAAYVLDAELAGFICLAASFMWAGWPFRKG